MNRVTFRTIGIKSNMQRLFVKALTLAAILWMATWAAALDAPTQLTPAPDASFTVAVIPDTQKYRGRGAKATPTSTDEVTNSVFEAQTRWIANNLVQQRIVFVSHVGDIVDRNNHDQWRVARRCMDLLHGRVPYGISPGNHDMTGQGDSSLFREYFPASRFKEFDWYGGSFPGNENLPGVSGNPARGGANSYQLFSAKGLDFIILHLECNAPDNVLAWAGQVLDEHANRRGIVTTHMYLGPLEKPRTSRDFADKPKGRMNWKKRHGERGNTPQQMWEKCLRRRGNLFLILCGDQSRTQAMRQTATGDQGNVVYEILSDYMQAPDGWMRLLRFLPKENRIEVYTYGPISDALCEGTSLVGERDQHQFVLEYEISAKGEK